MSTLSKRFPCDGNGDDDAYNKGWNDCLDALAAMEGEAVACQFQDRNGKWCGFSSEQHQENTIASGEWPIRYLYPAPPSPIDPAAVLALADRIERYAGGQELVHNTPRFRFEVWANELRALATGGQDGR